MKIASRASWGARYANGVGNRPVGSLQKYLHHTVTRHLPANATVAQERAEMRTVERIGQQRFGRGISYNICIFPSGRVYWGASIHRIAYHSGGGRDGKPRNTLGVGIVLVGNTHANEVTPQQQDALVAVLQHGVRQKWWNDPAITEGHRDFKATSCPGDYAYRLIPAINRRARGGTYQDFVRNGLPGSTGGSKPKPAPRKDILDMDEKQVRAIIDAALDARGLSIGSVRDGQSLHAGKVHEAVIREIEGRIVPLLEAVAGAVAALGSGEEFDQAKFMEGVRGTIHEALAGAEEALREAVMEAVAELPDRAPAEVAQAVVDAYVGRLAG